MVAVWAFDRMARSVRHLLDTIDELNRLNIEFICFRENIDTGGPLGRALITIIGAIAELERNLIIERVRCGMRRAKPEGRHIGGQPPEIDRGEALRLHQQGRSLAQIADAFRISRATVSRVLVLILTAGKSCVHLQRWLRVFTVRGYSTSRWSVPPK